ncbi:MAG: rhodanese-like domain-containing protein [Verrucomicrobiota bacterium]
MKTITPTQFSQNTSNHLLIDVRTPQEFQEIHIASALLKPLDDLDPSQLESQLGGKPPLVLTCFSGKRAEKAAHKLESAGWDITLLEGSLQGWEKAGLPVVRGTPTGIPLMRQVQIIVGALSLITALLALTVNTAWLWANVAMGAGLLFAGISGFCGLALVLGKMPWNRIK